MTIDQLKAELRAASPEAQEELFTLLGVIRRSGDSERQRRLTEKLDDPSRWIPAAEVARRLGLADESQ